MMSLGPMGCGAGGNSSSSTSNLSALAPPFTVDRLNPNPNSNPLMYYPDSLYAYEPCSHTWQYPHPSAPGPESIINSTGVSSGPLYDDYQFSASASISPPSAHWCCPSPSSKTSGGAYGYIAEADPYYSPYVPPIVGENSPVVEDNGPRYSVMPTSGLSVSSQIDYSPGLFDLEYGRQWVDTLGFDGGKRAKKVEHDGSFFSEKANVGGSSSFNNQLSQGACGIEYWNNSNEDPGAPYQKFNQGSDPLVHYGSSSVGHIEDKCVDQNLGFLPHESNQTHILASSSTIQEPHSLVSCEMHDNFSNYQNSCSPYEKCVRPVDSPFIGPVSTIRSTPTVVIRPPPATNVYLGQGIVSCEPAHNENVADVDTSRLVHPNSSKLQDSGLKPSSETKENSYDIFNFGKSGNDKIFDLSTSVKELPNPLHANDAFDRKMKARIGSQVPEVNVTSGFSMACDGVAVYSSEGSSDLLDHHHTAVDSPCWKGVPSSRFSLFDVEAGNSNHVKKKNNEHYRINPVERQILHSIAETTRHLSDKAGEVNKKDDNECAKTAVTFTSERTYDAIHPNREISDSSKPSKESGHLDGLKSGFEMEISGSKHVIGGTALNDVSEGGSVAVHVAEKVLASPSSQEDPGEPTKLPDSKLNVPTMIKTIHNLSELLFSHLSNDACSLEEEDTETLKHIISNLDSCMTKKITKKLQPSKPVGDSSDILGESCNVGTIPGSPHTSDEAAKSQLNLDSQRIHVGKMKDGFSGKIDEKSAVFSPLRDDLDITRDDDLAESIKKVLEENFHFEEEMHSQALLFKSLWLEAEAKLCSISYKARFDRMKIQMENVKRKAPQENEEIVRVMSKVSVSPDPSTSSELSREAHDVTIPNPTLKSGSICSTSRAPDDIEASVMARFHILKSREDSPKSVSVEKEHQNEMVDGEHAGSIMARLNILRSREEKSKSTNVEEEKHGMVDGEHMGPVMVRLNILKSRDDSSKSTSMEDEKKPEIFDGEFVSKKFIGDQPEDEILNVVPKPHFLHQSGGPGGGNFCSYVDGSGYESLKELYPSVMNELESFKNKGLINQDYSGSRDSSSSDWEHVLKDDFSWKNL